jgi:CRISPR-associated protein Cmr5
MRTLGQERAEFALNKILSVIKKEIDQKKLKAFSSGAPNMILQNGFGQALAFWLSKSKDNNHYDVIFKIVKEWLEKKNYVNSSNDKEFIENISKMSQQDYLKCQKESIALLEWVKRYANAFCEDNSK